MKVKQSEIKLEEKRKKKKAVCLLKENKERKTYVKLFMKEK